MQCRVRRVHCSGILIRGRSDELEPDRCPASEATRTVAIAAWCPVSQPAATAMVVGRGSGFQMAAAALTSRARRVRRSPRSRRAGWARAAHRWRVSGGVFQRGRLHQDVRGQRWWSATLREASRTSEHVQARCVGVGRRDHMERAIAARERQHRDLAIADDHRDPRARHPPSPGVAESTSIATRRSSIVKRMASIRPRRPRPTTTTWPARTGGRGALRLLAEHPTSAGTLRTRRRAPDRRATSALG